MASRIAAFAVHILTASGAALALLALMAAVRADWIWMFWWLGLALIVDAVDGPLARRLNVGDLLPDWSGDALDFVIDFTTYVFIPAYAIAASGLLPQPLAVPLGVLIVVTGALYFADKRMKLEGDYFRGFPVLWNVAAFYLFVIKAPAGVNAAGVMLLVVLTFVPFRFIHPVRVARGRTFNIALLALWSLLAATALARGLEAGPWITAGLCAIGVYFFSLGLLPRIPAINGRSDV